MKLEVWYQIWVKSLNSVDPYTTSHPQLKKYYKLQVLNVTITQRPTYIIQKVLRGHNSLTMKEHLSDLIYTL